MTHSTSRGAGDKARVLLADDHAEVRRQTANVLRGAFEVVGSVANGADLIAAAARLDPDVVVLDISMPDMDGIEAARRLRRAGCRAAVVFLTVHEDPDYVHAALDAGGTAYVAKVHLASHLGPAIHEALAGRRFVSPMDSWESGAALALCSQRHPGARRLRDMSFVSVTPWRETSAVASRGERATYLPVLTVVPRSGRSL